MTITEIRKILESPYERKVWKNFLQTQFTNHNLNAEDRPIILSDKTVSKECLSLGNYEINEYSNIGIFEVQLNERVNITRNRVALRNLIKDITKQVAGAMVVFVQGEKWRFSYISKRKVKNAATNEIEEKETAPKRYTYLFGKNEKALTAAIRFDKLIQKQKENIFEFLSLNDFEEAFSVEKLSKEFFKNYKEIYEDFVQFLTGKRYEKKGSKYIEQIIEEPNWQFISLFAKEDKAARDFCKRMMGRIIFLYFIQKKGWLAVTKDKKWGEGNPDYLYDLFRKSKYKDDFYARELVPLFFTRLNNEDSQNKAREERFPYLNGGLFDDTHDRKYCKLYLPEEIFARLFETFNNYNFTVYEDAPDEHTVAVDPEMLGHIFENLLEDNKDKGAFYTPKEIVHYMCKESLKAYLHTHDELHISDNDLGKSAIEKIIQQQELSEDEQLFAEKQAYKIIDALEQVKICDPAIGSGAFPMGLLLEIFNAQIYLQELKGFKKRVTDADIKKHIIEESIYGVDIDPGAVDIARLRFWLSLVVDEQMPQPLPNLDFKIVCANTLIPLGKLSGLDMEVKASMAVKELEKIRHNFFNVSSDEKLKIERQFKKVQTDLLSLRELTTTENYDVYTKLYEFNPFDGKSCSWFDPWWMFGIKDGFDIVIGNPPYVQLQKNSGNLSRQFEKVNYQTFERTGDIYSLFYERGWQLLKNKGVLCFITSNKWMRAGYGESTRKFFAEHTNPILLIDFAGQKIFEAATVDVNILMFNKDKNEQKTLACIVKEDVLNELSIFVRQQGTKCSFSSKESWTILSPVEESIKAKIEAAGTPLREWNINIYRGILTGYNEAFIIDRATKEKLIKEDPKSAEIIRPILRGRDIKRYEYDFANLWLLFIPWHFPLHTDPTIKGASERAEKAFKLQYPAVYNHLLSYKKELENRNKAETGIRYEWYALQRWGANYWEDFFKQKIIWKRVGSILRFSYDETGVLTLDSTCFATGKYIKFLVAVLNSKMGKFLMKDSPQTGTGDLLVSVQAIEPLKIPIPNKNVEKIIDKTVDRILNNINKSQKNSVLEKELDKMIYEMYELNMEEISFIESE